MADYKMLILDEKGTLKVTDSFAVDSDRLAQDRAQLWIDAGFGVELWQGKRQVEPPGSKEKCFTLTPHRL